MAHPSLVIGYGRFGAALCGLLEEAGLPVRAWDPSAPVPPERSGGTLDELVEDARFVVLAVPVSQIRPVLSRIRPHLSARHIVADVGSVKVGPAETLEELLGDEVPWVATHPLFGPDSLALGERPLRVVLCPNGRHGKAEREVSVLCRRLGCQVIEQDAHDHDRAMAATHALGFFVAGGLIDIGATFDSPVVPPSSSGLARLLRSVRGDAGHLLGVLHRANPYASPVRKSLLAALAELDHQLDHADVAPTLPDLGERSPRLRAIRDHIDSVDADLLELLARRSALARRAKAEKAKIGAGVRDPAREVKLRAARRERAEELGLDASAVDGIFGAIVRASVKMQEEG
jgi:prephenate dehydrogenase